MLAVDLAVLVLSSHFQELQAHLELQCDCHRCQDWCCDGRRAGSSASPKVASSWLSGSFSSPSCWQLLTSLPLKYLSSFLCPLCSRHGMAVDCDPPLLRIWCFPPSWHVHHCPSLRRASSSLQWRCLALPPPFMSCCVASIRITPLRTRPRRRNRTTQV